MPGTLTSRIVGIRAREPERIAAALRDREPGRMPDDRPLMVLACDHAARGALRAGADPMAMASREELLQRLVTALARPGVDGFLGTADLVEDLALLGALEGKLVHGSMNRGGLQGASFEYDDRFTGYDADGIVASRLDGGKMLLRIHYGDPGSASTLEAAARAVDALAARGRMAMVEPFLVGRRGGGTANDLSPDAVIRSITIASGLGRTSAHTWLKVPVVDDMERVASATTLPLLLLGGEVSQDPDATFDAWDRALALPTVQGLVIGRSLLFPPDDDVVTAVDRAAQLLRRHRRGTTTNDHP